MIKKISHYLNILFTSILLFDIVISLFSTYLAYSIRLESYHIPSFDTLNTYFICLIIFIPIYGLLGAAWATSCSMILWNIWALIVGYRRTGIRTLIFWR